MPSWGEILAELQPKKLPNGQMFPVDVDVVRKKYLKELFDYTGRNVIAYYSGWLKKEKTNNVDIADIDLTGFMNSIKGLDSSKGLDLILHTPGGDPTATEGIVEYLHKKFDDNIRVIVPHMAMSAGTMLACSAKSIIMGKHSFLGPIDPQFGGIPAYNIIEEFKEAKEELTKDEKAKSYWELQLKKYPAAFLYRVIDAIKLSTSLTSEWLKKYMFNGMDKDEKDKKTKKIISKLNANNMAHSRHFPADFCKEIGLSVEMLENDQTLQERVLSVHHSYIITLEITSATKIIENHLGVRFVSHQATPQPINSRR
jgi:hypothetical protein